MFKVFDNLKVFIAAPYPHKDIAIKVMNLLLDNKINVVSTWHNNPPSSNFNNAALTDIEDLNNANTLILLELDGGYGGKDREFGYALAKEMNLIVISENGPQCIYDFLSDVDVFTDIKSAIDFIVKL